MPSALDDQRSIDELKDVGSGRLACAPVVQLYNRAFEQFGIRALWSWRRLDRPTFTQVLAVADALRLEGDVAARRLAGEIEQACRAAL